MSKAFAIKGNIIWNVSTTEFAVVDDGFLVIEDGSVVGVFKALPEGYADVPIQDYTGKIVMPGMADIHVHAPQYTNRGLGLNMELLDWLNTYTFPEEATYADLAYAERAYDIFARDLKASATTRAVIFATRHVEATELLMDKLEATGLITYVGKVNQDRNSDPALEEKSAEASLVDTRRWLDDIQGHYERTMPILTPRFTPSCSDELMYGIGALKQERGLPLQSHLDENRGEVSWVKELWPDAGSYADTYLKCGQLEGPGKTIMAHCVYCNPEEITILKETGAYVAHCPESNRDLASGIAPARLYLDWGINMGLATDISGGPHLSMFSAVAAAIGLSKMRWVHVDESLSPLSVEEAIWLATAGGGSFFGKVGTFEPGYEADVLVLDDSGIQTARVFDTAKRLERFIYAEKEGGQVVAKFVRGQQIF